MFESIVVGYDGSAHARKALEMGAKLAASEQARLGIICVVDTNHVKLPAELRDMGEVEHIIEPMPRMVVDFEQMPPALTSTIAKSQLESQRAMLQYADHLASEAARHAREYGAPDVEAITASGDPAEEVVEYASKRNADLIVCGRRGLGRVKQLLLGSTSHKIAQLAGCSCLTVK